MTAKCLLLPLLSLMTSHSLFLFLGSRLLFHALLRPTCNAGFLEGSWEELPSYRSKSIRSPSHRLRKAIPGPIPTVGGHRFPPEFQLMLGLRNRISQLPAIGRGASAEQSGQITGTQLGAQHTPWSMVLVRAWACWA